MSYLSKASFSVILISAFYTSVNAQKLPAIQQESMKAPARVLVDGKLTEWPTPLMAQNNAIGASYSLSNDNRNLYLLIQAKDSQIIKKIIGGGVTLAVTASDNKPPAQLTFPILKTAQKNTIGIKYNNRMDALMGPEDLRVHKADSILATLNTEISIDMKDVKLAGMKGQTDSLVSVYNSEGFKAAIAFDKQFNLNMEVAVPLDALGINSGGFRFEYKLSVNAINFDDTAVHMRTPSGEPVIVKSIPRSIYTGSNSMDAINSTTYCKGMYTLIK